MSQTLRKHAFQDGFRHNAEYDSSHYLAGERNKQWQRQSREVGTWKVPSTTTLRGNDAVKVLATLLFFPKYTAGILARCTMAFPAGDC